MDKPIALLITAYNRQALLERTLASLEGHLQWLDIILVDDGSVPALQLEKFSHYPIHLIRLPHNSGVVAAANAGLEYIYAQNYEYLARLDSDDVVTGARFEKQVALLREHPDIGAVGSNFYIVDTSGKVVAHSVRPGSDGNIRKAMHIGNVLYHSSMMMRTDIARKNGFYDTRYSVSEDYDFFWRMLAITNIVNMPDFFINYETGAPQSQSVAKAFLMAFNALTIKLRHFSLFNPYAYMGLVFSLLDMTGLLKYTVKLRKALLKLIFAE